MARRVTKDDIIQATLRCTFQLGLENVTINAIGKEVGILGQGLYNHFQSKDEILAAVFAYCNSQLSALYDDFRLDPDDDLQTALYKLWIVYFNYFVEHPAVNRFYRQFRELLQIPKGTEDQPYFVRFWKLIDQLEAQHHFLHKIPTNVLIYYIRTVTPYLARALSENIMEDTPEVRQQFWLMVANGLSILWS